MRWRSRCLTIVFLFVCLGCYGQQSTISLIDKSVNAINGNIKHCRKVSREIMESTEGGVLIGYFDHDRLTKMVAVYYCETHRAVVQYYFTGQGVCFVSWKDFEYSKPIYEKGGGKVNKVQLKKYYFKKTLIRAIPNTQTNRDESKDLVSDIERYTKMLSE